MDVETLEQYQEHLRVLVPVNKLPAAYQNQLLASAEVLDFQKRDHIFRQGQRDRFSFYVLEGTVEMYANDQLIKTVVGGEGASFNPLSQLQPRQMTAVARTPVRVLRFDRLLLEKLLSANTGDTGFNGPSSAFEVREIDASANADWLTELLKSDLFSRIPPSNIENLLQALEPVRVPTGTDIIGQGDVGDYYYVIKSGRCEVVRRTANTKRDIRLAELGPGDTFGEEALVSNARRNATVRTLTDCELARLTKEDFIRLISAPVLRSLSADQALQRAAGGGVVLIDVRFPEESSLDGIPTATNIPLNILRMRARQLDKQVTYIAYCDTGGRSSTAAFILTELGFDCYFLPDGGLCGRAERREPAPVVAAVATASAETPAKPALNLDSTIDCDVTASALMAELAQATMQIEEARRMMAEAERLKQEAREHVERELSAERERLAEEARLTERKMLEAERLRQEIEAQKAEAERESARRHSEHAARLARVEQETLDRLRQKELELEQMYQRTTEQIDDIQARQAEDARLLAQQRADLAAADTLSRERLQALQAKEQALAEEASRHDELMAARDVEMRDALTRELNEERRRLEGEFAQTTAELQLVRQEKEAAEAARLAATAEASRIIDEFRQQHERDLGAAEQARRQLEAESTRLQQVLNDALARQARAESSRSETEQLLDDFRNRYEEALRNADVRQAELHAELESMELKVAEADQRVAAASADAANALTMQQENERQLRSAPADAAQLAAQLHSELDGWIDQQNSDDERQRQQDFARRRLEIAQRIKSEAERARNERHLHDRSLLADLESQLRDLASKPGK
ncbi:MAG: cyclic nucleotide-binding domain-containing protein [Gammaproteobacteria bacterium]|nr:cyclic nucleotide-binding domain-containing protein [Gammaproteobacteria bacterium]